MAEYRFRDGIRGVVDYTNYSYKTMGEAAYYGAGIIVAISKTSAGASYPQDGGRRG